MILFICACLGYLLFAAGTYFIPAFVWGKRMDGFYCLAWPLVLPLDAIFNGALFLSECMGAIQDKLIEWKKTRDQKRIAAVSDEEEEDEDDGELLDHYLDDDEDDEEFRLETHYSETNDYRSMDCRGCGRKL